MRVVRLERTELWPKQRCPCVLCAAALAGNKFFQTEAIREAGLNACGQRLAHTREDVEKFLSASPDVNFKAVVKPVEGAGSDGVFICDSHAQAAPTPILALATPSRLAKRTASRVTHHRVGVWPNTLKKFAACRAGGLALAFEALVPPPRPLGAQGVRARALAAASPLRRSERSTDCKARALHLFATVGRQQSAQDSRGSTLFTSLVDSTFVFSLVPDAQLHSRSASRAAASVRVDWSESGGRRVEAIRMHTLDLSSFTVMTAIRIADACTHDLTLSLRALCRSTSRATSTSWTRSRATACTSASPSGSMTR
eukprot:6212710-Pleurochrysis_carterae.AAC.3